MPAEEALAILSSVRERLARQMENSTSSIEVYENAKMVQDLDNVLMSISDGMITGDFFMGLTGPAGHNPGPAIGKCPKCGR